MGRKCNVSGCLSDSRREEDHGVTYHKMPPHSDLRPKWISLCRIPEKQQANKVIYVCSRHFLRADFCQFKGTKYFLRQGALPSVFPWAPNPKVSQDSQIADESMEVMKIKIKTEFDSDQEAEYEQINEKTNLEIKQESDMSVGDIDNFKMKEDMFGSSKSVVTPPIIKTENIINFTLGGKIEASDFGDKWYPALIQEIDYDENEVLVHYEKCSNRGDEWIPMDSSRLRPFQTQQLKKPEPFKEGEKCLAVWTDARKFPATITKIINEDTYEVLFDDGFIKVLKRNKITKLSEPIVAQDNRLHMSPLFDPVIGSKEERRERKRKINVAELFSTKKRCRNDDYLQDDEKLSQEDYRLPGSSQYEGEEWTCRWMNGEPVGEESLLESIDGPRRSVIVPDHRLPQGWEKHLCQRLHGSSAGKWETIIRSPEGKKFRTRSDIKTYLQERGLNYVIEQFDFGLHLNRARKLGLYEITDPDVSPTISARARSTKHVGFKSASRNSLPLTPEIPEPDEEEEDDSNCLKIIMENDSYKCPIEGCGKNFRKENLAQMHIKHYHPEYTKLLGSTPNVADLAYARTVGESIEDIVPKARAFPINDKSLKVDVTPKSKSSIKVLAPKTPLKCEETDLKKIERSLNASSPQNIPKPATKDAEIIRLLSSDPKSKGIDSIFEPGPGNNDPFKFDNTDVKPLPEGIKYPDIKLKDLLYKAEPLPIKKEEARVGIKTLLPVIRNSDEIKKENEDSDGKNVLIKDKLRFNRKRHISDNERRRRIKYDDDYSDFGDGDSQSQDAFKKMEPQLSEQPQVIIEGGEVIRLVHMRREEIINCICGITEEDGLMIQCELCLCWQHGHCNNIFRENQVPEKYVCYICTHPQKMRQSKKFIHDQDWLKKGTLATSSYHAKDEELLMHRFETLRKSHELSGCLIELDEYLYNLKIKLHMAGNKDHPKMYLWAKPWDKVEVDHNIDLIKPEDKTKCELKDLKNDSFSDDHSYLKSSAFGDLSLKTVLEPPIKEEPDTEDKIHSQSELISILEGRNESPDKKIDDKLPEFPKIDLNNIVSNLVKSDSKSELDSKENELSSLTSGLLSSGSLDLPLTQSDLEKLSTLAQLGDVDSSVPMNGCATVPCIPQPEAAIDSSNCQINLLDHIEFSQNLVEKRLDAIERIIASMEKEETEPATDETHELYPRTKQTVQMLIRDINTMRQISSISH